ncbi:hypothetical protein B0H67DRAFT_311427 [Lasiosphaeris hirsuta]|uniref:Secreted protein n=1 Tax=Lasiosphaeris hirsuta TaxID=260670 RepID=A0AA40A192_9PEZI|nr:hypothetical protein B0H67DRAFT_311427 [Lasiosphaeris hirsuta]
MTFPVGMVVCACLSGCFGLWRGGMAERRNKRRARMCASFRSWQNKRAEGNVQPPSRTGGQQRKSMSSCGWFRSNDLRVMSPARFRFATQLVAVEPVERSVRIWILVCCCG